jgi:RHS repeat-associated protein
MTRPRNTRKHRKSPVTIFQRRKVAVAASLFVIAALALAAPRSFGGWTEPDDPGPYCEDCECFPPGPPGSGPGGGPGDGPQPRLPMIPMGNSVKASSGNPITLSQGSILESAVDLKLPGPVLGWKQSRSYRSNNSDSGQSVLGDHWEDGLADYRITAPYALNGFPSRGDDGSITPSYDNYELRLSASGIIPLVKASTVGSLIHYTVPADYPMMVVEDTAADEFIVRATYSDQVFVFHSFEVADAEHQGRLKEMTTRQWLDASKAGWICTYDTSDSRLKQLTPPAPQDGFSIYYRYEGVLTQKISSVEVFDGDDTGTLLMSVHYTYWDDVPTENYDLGTSGALVQVKTSILDSSEANYQERYTQYRYVYIGGGGGPGGTYNVLKAVYEHSAIQQMIAATAASDVANDLLEMEDDDTVVGTTDVADYASRSFAFNTDPDYYATYGDYWRIDVDTSDVDTAWEANEDLETKYGAINYWAEYIETRVTSERIGAAVCPSCSGSGSAQMEYQYHVLKIDQGGNFYNHAHTWHDYGDYPGDINEVSVLVVEDTLAHDDPTNFPDGRPLYRTIYGLNNFGRTLRKVIIEDPTAGTLRCWCWSWTYVDSDADDDQRWTNTGGGDNPNLKHRIAEYRLPSAYNVTTATHLQKFLDPYDDPVCDTPDSFVNATVNYNDATETLFANDSDVLRDTEGVIYVYEYDESGRRTCTAVKQGETGIYFYVEGWDWGGGTSDEPQDRMVASYAYPVPYTDTATDSTRIQTKYEYDFWDSADMQLKRVATLKPAVVTAENGAASGSSDPDNATVIHDEKFYDQYGRLRWTKDGEGYVNYYSYSPSTGGLAYVAVDVDPTSLPSSADLSGNIDKWDPSTVGDADGLVGTSAGQVFRPTGLPTALAIVTSVEFDAIGREKLRRDPPTEINTSGAMHYTAYEVDGAVERVIKFPYWNSSNDQPRAPIQVSETDASGRLAAQYTLAVATPTMDTSSTYPVALGSTLESAVKKSLTKYIYDGATGRVEEVQRYHDTTGTTPFDDFYSTHYLYDGEGRVGVTVQDVASGKFQVAVTLRDVLGRLTETRRAVTSTAPTAANFATLTGSLPSGYAVVSTTTYDGGGIGDSLITKSRQYHTAGSGAKYTDSVYHRTYRGHLRGVERQHYSGSTADVKPYHVYDVDWLGRTTATAKYTTEPSTWPSDYTQYVHNANPSSPSPTTSGHYELQVSYYDVLGRVFRTERYPGTVTTGRIQKNSYYDRRDLLVCTGDQYGAHMEYVYDGAGRQFEERTIKDVQATKYNSGAFNYCEPDAADPTGGDEGVVHMVHTDLNAAGDVTGVHDYEMTHTDTNGISLSDTTSFVRRTQYSWYDAADRLIATADYGSGDGTSTSVLNWKYTSVPTRPSSAPTWDSSEISNGYVHLTTYGYDAAARQDAVTIGVRWMGSSSTETYVTKDFYDDLGRRRFSVENDLGSNPLSGSPTSGTDPYRTTGWIYDGLNNVAQLIAYNSDSTSQTTNYYYTDPYNASLATYTTYPDSSSTPSSGTDLVKRDYDLDGRVNKMKDQRGVEHTYTYTASRLLELDDVTNLPSGVDGAVRSIKRFYDDLQRLTYVNSYPNVNAGGTLLNFVGFAYSGGGNVRYLHQAHDGTWTNVQTFDHVNDNNATSGLIYNGARLTKLVYPNGAIVEYGHGAAPWYNQGNMSDRLSQVTTMTFTPPGGSAAEVAAYQYNGVDRVVETDYTVPDVRRRMFGVDSAGTNDYNGWDRFGRTVRHQWQDYTSTVVTRDRFDYENDYAGNRVHRANAVASTGHDQIYGYDRMMRLATMEEGTMSGGSLTGTHTFDEGWTLDALGNWGTFTQSVNGTTTLDQARSHNVVNEIDVNISDTDSPGASITASVGANWTDPSYDAAGNMDSLPQSYAPTASYTLVYDAWNRLVSVYDTTISAMVSKLQYDGLNRLIVRQTDYEHLGGFETRHYYYNIDWQVVEERAGTTSTPPVVAQYVWHPHYVDAIAMRRYDSDRDGNLAEGHDGDHYYLQDANYNVTAVLNASGFALERYAYTPYGKPTTLNGSSGVDPDGSVGEFDVDISYSVMRDTFSDIGNTVLYTGREYDWETGLQLNRNRAYASNLGRWLTRDPIGYVDGRNLYQYTSSNPMRSFDPLGLFGFGWYEWDFHNRQWFLRANVEVDVKADSSACCVTADECTGDVKLKLQIYAQDEPSGTPQHWKDGDGFMFGPKPAPEDYPPQESGDGAATGAKDLDFLFDESKLGGSLDLGTVPCSGGAVGGFARVYSVVDGPALYIQWGAIVEECGNVNAGVFVRIPDDGTAYNRKTHKIVPH